MWPVSSYSYNSFSIPLTYILLVQGIYWLITADIFINYPRENKIIPVEGQISGQMSVEEVQCSVQQDHIVQQIQKKTPAAAGINLYPYTSRISWEQCCWFELWFKEILKYQTLSFYLIRCTLLGLELYFPSSVPFCLCYVDI